ncbi:MAG TPA: autotransporter-associated beta strand repeat-containing protein [Pirellulales bacterium]|nr:autotransporter-associated beta strand repeat-containing protein [Pirellulales bacterium]
MVRLVLSAAAVLALGRIGAAADIVWSVSSGNWNTPANWTGGHLPGPADNSYIGNGEAANITGNLANPTVTAIYVGGTTDQGGPVGGNGTLNMSAGSIAASNWFIVGDLAGTTGTFNLSGGSVNVTSGDVFDVGDYGTGVFNLSGTGSVSVAGGTLVVGRWGDGTAAASGAVSQTGAATSVVANEMDIGAVGRQGTSLQTQAVYTQNNGKVATNNGFHVGPIANSNGLYTIRNGSLTVGAQMDVGLGGTGAFVQQGGAVTVTGNGNTWLYIGTNAGSHGSYTISGGSLNVNNRMIVGEDGFGTVTQTGATTSVNIGQDISVGDHLGSSTAATPDAYNIGAGTITTGNGFLLGWSGYGTVNQTGGAVTANGNGIQFGGNNGTGQGIYNLSGGTLTVSQVFQGAAGVAAHQFNFTGGTLQIGEYNFGDLIQSATSNPSVLDVTQNDTLLAGRYILSSGAALVDNGHTLDIAGDAHVGDTGGTANMTQNSGTVTIDNGSWLYLGMTAGSNGTYNLAGGTLLPSAREIVGNDGLATFNQSGGSNVVPMDISVADHIGNSTAAQPDTYNLSGGTLSTSGTGIQSGLLVGWNGYGLFNQTGGTASFGGNGIQLSGNGGFGTYALSGGTVSTSQIFVNGGQTNNAGGGGFFLFNGGTLMPTGSSTTFLQTLTGAKVQAGGAIIDTSGFNITVAQPLVHDVALGPSLDGGLTKAGAGTLTLTGGNLYTGPTKITAGTLQVLPGAASQPGLFEGRVNGAFNTYTLNPQTSIQTTTRYANIADNSNGNTYPATAGAWQDNTTFAYTGYLKNNSNGNVTWTFAENFDDNVLLQIDGNVVLNDNQPTVPTLANYTLTPGLHTFELRLGQVGGAVGPSNQGWFNNGLGLGVDTQGRGQQVAANYVALTDPGNGSLLVTSVPVLPPTTPVVMSSNSTLDITGASMTIGSLADAPGSPTGHQVLLGNATLTTGNDNTNTTFSGVISGTGGALTKIGAGIFTLAGANAYTGPTAVSNGTLRIAGSLAGGAVTIGDQSAGHAATLTGTGTINGAVTVNGPGAAGTGGTIAGATGATLHLAGGLALAGGSISTFTLAAPNGSSDVTQAMVNITGGSLTGPASGLHTINLSGSPQPGTYDLYAFTGTAPSLAGFTLGAQPAGFRYSLSLLSNQLDLIASESSAWNFAGNGNYGDNSKWDQSILPNAAGQTAAFGNGTTNNIGSPPVVAANVTIDGNYTVGALEFNNNQATTFDLSYGGAATGLTLNGSGFGATVTVSNSNNNPTIYTNLTLADSTTFNIAASSSLTLTIGGAGVALTEIGGSHTLTKTGAGTLILDRTSSYSGSTTVNAGVLTVTATGALGGGPLIVNGASVSSVVNLNNNQTLASLAGAVSGGGSARVNVASGTTLGINEPPGSVSYGGLLALASGGAPGAGAALAKSGSGAEILTAAPVLGNNTTLNVSGGTLKLNVSSGSASVGTGVTANITGSGVLELAGSVSALGTATPPNRVAITNNSNAAAGLLISAGNQQVGGIGGAGNTQVSAGSDLTADHIIQNSLIIGGTAGSPALVTIDASDSGGNPLAESNGFALASSIEPSDPFAVGSLTSSNLVVSDGSTLGDSALLGRTPGGGTLGGNTAVPETTTLLLMLIGLSCVLGRRIAQRRHAGRDGI